MDFTHMTIIKKNINTSKPRAIIKDIKKSNIVATGEEFIEVEVWIYEGTTKVDVKKLGYPIETLKADIIADVKKHMKLMSSEKTQKEKQKIVDDKDEKVSKEIKKLENLEIK